MSNIEEMQKYRHIYDIHMHKITNLIQDEFNEYNRFLVESNIQTLPDNHYKDGKTLDYGEVRRLYDNWWELNSAKKDKTEEK